MAQQVSFIFNPLAELLFPHQQASGGPLSFILPPIETDTRFGAYKHVSHQFSLIAHSTAQLSIDSCLDTVALGS